MQFIVIILFLLMQPFSGYAAAKVASEVQAMQQKTTQMIQLFKDIEQQKMNAAQTCEQYKKISQYFDLTQMTSDALRPHQKALGSALYNSTQQQFEKLVRLIAFRDAKSTFATMKYTMQTKLLANDRKKIITSIEAYVESEDLDIVVGAVWAPSGNQRKITDILIDGDSMVLDYNNQFARIIQNEGAEELATKISQRYAEEKAKGGTCSPD